MSQFEDYQKEYPDVEVIGCPADGIAPTRQWIVHQTRYTKFLCMVDDDARFFYRPDMASPKLVSILENPYEQEMMWSTIENSLLLGIPWVGISYRSGNNNVTIPYQECTKSFSVWAVNLRVLRRHRISFTKTPVMEDFQVILQLLSRGYKNRVYFRWAWDQGGSNAPGGCSDWRTLEVQALGARELQKLFPEFVRCVEKQPKSGWYGNKPRLDVVIQWKKCYESGLAKMQQGML